MVIVFVLHWKAGQRRRCAGLRSKTSGKEGRKVKLGRTRRATFLLAGKGQEWRAAQCGSKERHVQREEWMEEKKNNHKVFI